LARPEKLTINRAQSRATWDGVLWRWFSHNHTKKLHILGKRS
jgi:hypothetical protein